MSWAFKILCPKWCIQKDKLKSLLSVSSLAAKFGDHLFSSNLVERPSFLSGGYDLLWGQDEPVEASVSQLNTVHIWDVGNTKSPVEGGARCSVEDTWDAANLIVFPMDCMKSIIASEGKVIHCIVARSRSLSVAPWYKDELAVAVERLVEDDPVLSSFHLRERLRTIISLAAAVTRGSSLRPMEIPVPVSVSSLAGVSVVLGCGLSPHSVVVP